MHAPFFWPSLQAAKPLRADPRLGPKGDNGNTQCRCLFLPHHFIYLTTVHSFLVPDSSPSPPPNPCTVPCSYCHLLLSICAENVRYGSADTGSRVQTVQRAHGNSNHCKQMRCSSIPGCLLLEAAMGGALLAAWCWGFL